MSAIQNFDYLDRLSTIKAPTLVICGDQDEGTPPDRNKLIASKIPAAATRASPTRATCPTSSGPSSSTAS
jgi:pimeloyl-ACP methyl ester carboxylesterase